MNGDPSREATAEDRTACAHCALPVPPALLDPDGDLQFCCHGCRTVYQAIHACGLQRFYELQDPTDAGVQANPTYGRYEYLDEAAFHEQNVRSLPSGHAFVELYLEGLHCAACVWLIERLPQVQQGVVEARVDIRRQVVGLAWDAQRVELSRLARLLDSLGYPAHPYRGGKMHDIRRREIRRQLVRIAVAGAIAGNVMLISFALFGGMFAPMEPQYRALFRWISLGLTVLALIWPGRPFLIGALSSLRTRTMHMDLPVAIALVAGTLWGAVNTVRGSGETYFESLTAVILLLLVGRYVLYRQQRAAQDSIELLFTLTPTTARLIEDGGVREVSVESLKAGSRVELRGGDSVPADGVIVEGRSDFDFSLLTGESRPVGLGPGDRIYAGTHNLSARIVLDVGSTGEQTRLGRLMLLVEKFSRTRPPIVRLADRVAHYFVIAVLLLAVVTALIWLRLDPTAALENAITLLIVTCPCALGLATPLAVVAAIGQAARHDILVKGGEALESLARSGLFLLDKTGTVTVGSTELLFWEGDDAIRPHVAAMESHVSHPIATAFVNAFGGKDVPVPRTEVTALSGSGLEGQSDGRTMQIGSPSFIETKVGAIPGWARRAEDACLDRVLSPVMVASDGTVVAVAGFGDPVQEDAERSVATLRDRGWKVRVLSGDHPRLVREVARSIGLTETDVEGGASPERKADVVLNEVKCKRNVVMVGDGVNDAAALSAATVGVAVHGGAEASLAAADVFIRRPGLGPLVALVDGARRTVGVIRRNIIVSLLYNLITAALAMAGLINPLIAAVLMPLSSLTVVTLSYRSRTFSD